MMMKIKTSLLAIGLLIITTSVIAQKNAMAIQDVMKFKSLQHQTISPDGNWVSASAWPDRGDGEVIVHKVNSRQSYTIERGKNPRFSPDSRWLGTIQSAKFIEIEKAKTPADRPKDALVLLSLNDGVTTVRPNTKDYIFLNDGNWLIVHYHPETIPDSLKKYAPKRKSIGTNLEVYNLLTSSSVQINHVASFTVDSTSTHLVFAVSDTVAARNHLSYINLRDSSLNPTIVHADSGAHYSNFSWHHKSQQLAFIHAIEGKDEKPGDGNLNILNASDNIITTLVANDEDLDTVIPVNNAIEWNVKANQLFFGIRRLSKPEKSTLNVDKDDIYDFDTILTDVGVDVWHGDDPRIKTHERIVWRSQQNHTFRSVYHFESSSWTQLADEDLSTVFTAQNGVRTLGIDDRLYLREQTWDGRYFDLYSVELGNGDKTLIKQRLSSTFQLSPDGRSVVYFNDRNWVIHHLESGISKNLTENLGVTFFNEDHDSPSDPSGYGIAGWTSDGSEVMIYDKFDIWGFNTNSGEAKNLTIDGRPNHRQYRVQFFDDTDRMFNQGHLYLLSAYNDKHKHTGFYSFESGKMGTIKLIEDQKRFRFISKASDSDVILFSREAYDEFPDLWVANSRFNRPSKVTNLDTQREPFAWGQASLVEWLSMDGTPVQGVLILPGNYRRGDKVPVIVYFYELFSQRLYEFNPQLVNHRPSFPFYASNGYAIFLPDVRYTEGQPGYSATKFIVPGVQKLIEMGVADPKAIGLHGHSWSGYQAAFMITQTDIFAAVVSGAPVSNMTSAYNGIRWGSGLARQFQYEKTQSRLGKTLWERPDLYIENSPVFYADRINTPLLIQFGDEDDAVPWYQGIELYLAMRRLDKDVIFLQYFGEPHHLRKYANKLDYTIKMKEYFDYYLKGTPAPDWIKYGVPFKGN
jgi:dipeptidyl aminopeptidase/acylaminoacyl peptidase